MSLIKCVECGKEYSDKAQCCPNCACPRDESLINSCSTEDNKIIATYNILGYDFNISEKLDFRLKLISEFNLKKKMIEMFVGQLYEKLGNIDAVIEQIPEFLSDFLEATIQGSIDLLTKNNVFEYDEQHFFEKYGNYIDATVILEPVVTRYLEIQGLHDKIEEYHRQLRYVHRNSWSGGGFGIKGAIKGHLKAQMLNAGTSFLTSFSDNKIHNENLQEIQNVKTVLYNNIDTKQSVIKAVINLYTNCFNCVLNEFKNAGKLNDTFFEDTKSDSIVNNILKRINASKDVELSSFKTQIIEAFKANPLNLDVIHLIIILEEYKWENALDEEIIMYIKEYELLDAYIEYRIDSLARRHHKEIIEFKNLALNPVISFDKYKEIEMCYFSMENIFYEECRWIDKTYVCEKLELLSILTSSILEYSKYDKTLEDNQKMCLSMQQLADKLSSLGYNSKYLNHILKFLEIMIKKIKSERVIDYNFTSLLTLIETVCLSHSEDYNCTDTNGFYFANINDINKIKYYKYYKESAEIPDDANIYMLCAKMQFSPMTARCVIAVTNYGIYIYQNQTEKLEKIYIFYSWHNLSNLNFSIPSNGGIDFDGQILKGYSWELYHILYDLKSKVISFLKDHEKYKSELGELSTQDRMLTEFEVNEIDQYYEMHTESLGKKLYYIISQNYKSNAAKEKINKKKAELIEHIEKLKKKQQYKRNYGGIISVISGILAFGIGVWIFLKYDWKFWGIWLMLCGVCYPFSEIKKANEKNDELYAEAIRCKKELEEIESLFVIQNDDIKLK